MPVEPSSELLNRWIKKPVKRDGPKREPTPLDPSWLRTGFEGVVDTILGMGGVGPDSKMNRIGQMVSAAGPMMNPKKLLSTKIPKAIKGTPIYDDAGRFLAFENPPDEAYAAHVGSSVGKHELPKKVGVSPSDAAYEIAMKGRWRQQR